MDLLLTAAPNNATVFGTPFVKAGIAEAMFASDFLDGHACFGLPQKPNDLLFAVFACSHVHHSPGLMDFLED